MSPTLGHHDDNNPYDSDIIYHHALPVEGTPGATANDPTRRRANDNPTYASQRRPPHSAQQLQHLDNGKRSHTSAEVGASKHRHGLSAAAARSGLRWRPQGMLAGEWRDRFGRTRRACPKPSSVTCHGHQNAGAPAGSQHRAASFGGYARSLAGSDKRCPAAAGAASSCAGTDTSFEGLVEELRKRLPRTFPLMELVTAQHIQMVYGDDNDNGIPNSSSAVAMTGGGVPMDSKRGRGYRIEAREEFPPGCLRLRRAVGIAGQKEGSLSEARSRKLGENGNNQSGVLPATAENDAVGPLLSSAGHGILLFADGNSTRVSNSTNRVASITTALSESASSANSPSAAMVAAAKAQERALPLLQVCAVQVTPGGQPRISKGAMGVGVR